MPEAKGGRKLGAENATRVRNYLAHLEASGRRLPDRNGKPNMATIALAAGVDRHAL